MKCPTCHSHTRLNRSRYITPELREIVRVCTNTNCGRIFRSHEEFIKDILTSAYDEKRTSEEKKPAMS